MSTTATSSARQHRRVARWRRQALISKVIKTEDLQTDGAKVANALLGVARDLEQSADRDDERDDNSAFDVIPFYPRPPIFWPR